MNLMLVKVYKIKSSQLANRTIVATAVFMELYDFRLEFIKGCDSHQVSRVL